MHYTVEQDARDLIDLLLERGAISVGTAEVCHSLIDVSEIRDAIQLARIRRDVTE